MVDGLTQAADGIKVTIPILNLGQSTPVSLTGGEITINSSIHHVVSGRFGVLDTINGGEEGDLLLLTSSDVVFISTTGNIEGRPRRLSSDNITSFVFIDGKWVPW